MKMKKYAKTMTNHSAQQEMSAKDWVEIGLLVFGFFMGLICYWVIFGY